MTGDEMQKPTGPNLLALVGFGFIAGAVFVAAGAFGWLAVALWWERRHR